MGYGSVTVVQQNNAQGNFSESERVFLYVGKAAAGKYPEAELIPIGAASDLNALLGAGDSELKTQIQAAKVNSNSENFVCYALAIPEGADWAEEAEKVLDKPADVNVEAVVLCSPVTSKVAVLECQTFASEIRSSFAKFVTVFASVEGINIDGEDSESWGDYIERISALNDGVAAERVCLVPLLHGNDLGCVSGRLCNPDVSLADSPMRVATGAVIGLGEAPVDKDGNPLNTAIIRSLAEARFSVAQWYVGYDGMYWADHCTLDAEGGDFQEWENLRIMDYLARRVRILAIKKIADRRLNNTPKSNEFAKTYFSRPLRDASKSIVVGGIEVPGMIKSPRANAISIVWANRTNVAIGITAQPHNCPKSITLYLALDLSGD